MTRRPDRWSRLWQFHALWGALAFLGFALGQPLRGLRAAGGVGYVLAFAALVIVPLGASLAAMPRRDGSTQRLYRVAARTHTLAVLAAVGSLILTPSPPAAVLAGVWLLQTLLLAGFGAWRFASHGVNCLEELTLDVGLLQVWIGGAWWVATCAGWRLGFPDLIVQLTAVHFHYAGFAAPIICGLAGRAVAPRPGHLRRLYKLTCWTVMLAVWIVAVGIAISAWAELAGAVLLAAGMTLLAALLCGVLPRRSGRRAGRLFVVAGLSLALPMVLAVAYAAGELGLGPGIDIPAMTRWHGLLNAFGFAGAGLTAFALWRPPSRCAAPHPPFSRLAGGWRIGPDFFDRKGLVDAASRPTGLIDDLGAYRREGFDPEGIHPSVRRFYEHTLDFDLHVEARWSFGFRVGGRLFRRLTAAVGQLNVPLGRLDEAQMESRLFALRDDRDGRDAVRAWVRSYAASRRPVYVAAYSLHESAGIPYMNIAFPLPGGNLASLLRMDPIAGCPGSLSLTTLPEAGRIGDEGVYFANRALPVRLPLDETVRVWPRDEAPATVAGRFEASPADAVFARHDLSLAGLRYLTIDYLLIRRREPESQLEPRDPRSSPASSAGSW